MAQQPQRMMAEKLTTRDPFQRAAQPNLSQQEQQVFGAKERLDVGVETAAGEKFADGHDSSRNEERSRRRYMFEATVSQSLLQQQNMMFLQARLDQIDGEMGDLAAELERLEKRLAELREQQEKNQAALDADREERAGIQAQIDQSEADLETARAGIEQGEENLDTMRGEEDELAAVVAENTLTDELGRRIMFVPDENGEIADHVLMTPQGDIVALSELPIADRIRTEAFIAEAEETPGGPMILSATAGITTKMREDAAADGQTVAGESLNGEAIAAQEAEIAQYQLTVDAQLTNKGFLYGRRDALDEVIAGREAEGARLAAEIAETEAAHSQGQERYAELETERAEINQLIEDYESGALDDAGYHEALERMELTDEYEHYMSMPEITTFLANGYNTLASKLTSVTDSIANFFGGDEEPPAEEAEAPEEYTQLVSQRNELLAERDFMRDINKKMASPETNRETLVSSIDERYDDWQDFRTYYAENTVIPANPALQVADATPQIGPTKEAAAALEAGPRTGTSAAGQYDPDGVEQNGMLASTFRTAATAPAVDETTPSITRPQPQPDEYRVAQNNAGMGGGMSGMS